MPLLRRIPKRGFTSPFPARYQVLNVRDLDSLFQAQDEVSPKVLLDQGILKRNLPIKILGTGELKKPLKVSAQGFSAQAKEKIEKAGGTATLLTQ